LRIFGVAGDASPNLRWYAARHGITLIERTRWPAPVLADPYLRWPTDAAELARTRAASLALTAAPGDLPSGAGRGLHRPAAPGTPRG
jgi:hypothetical protein